MEMRKKQLLSQAISIQKFSSSSEFLIPDISNGNHFFKNIFSFTKKAIINQS